VTNLRDFIRSTANQIELELNLRGKTRARCTACNGTGNREPGRTDYDAHGPYYVSPAPCHSCLGNAFVEARCSADDEARAIRTEIGRLQARLAKIERGEP